jgi:trimeric autotransporter adhesin
MNTLILQFQKITPLSCIVLALGCLALSQTAQAVSPPPDGGYPGGNTAEGRNALLSLTSGTYNTAIGFLSLSNTDGSFNTAVGAGTLIATSGEQNTATGAGALLSNSTGFRNTANGVFALFNNTAGFSDTASGAFALFNNTTGGTNTANGESALYINSTGDGNTATGWSALRNNSAGSSNTAAGYQALFFNHTGDNNTSVGVAALVSSTTGSNNTALGYGAGSNIFAADNVICIGANVAGVDVSDTCFIGNIRDVTTQNGDAIGVVIDSAGQLGTISSSARFKKEIKPMDKASEAVLALRPVTFRYKSDKTNTPQFGLIAEEVAKVNPELVVRNKDGEIYTVRYEAVNAMLLNEFLKEHRRNEEKEATIAELKKELQAMAAHQQKQIEALTAGLQKVSAQLEVSKPAPQVVNNP